MPMRDLLRYMLIAVLVVVAGWFLIGELKEWTVVDNSVNIEDSSGWELLVHFNLVDTINGVQFNTYDYDFLAFEVIETTGNGFGDKYDSAITIINKHSYLETLRNLHKIHFGALVCLDGGVISYSYYYDLFTLENVTDVYNGATDYDVKVWGVK